MPISRKDIRESLTMRSVKLPLCEIGPAKNGLNEGLLKGPSHCNKCRSSHCHYCGDFVQGDVPAASWRYSVFDGGKHLVCKKCQKSHPIDEAYRSLSLTSMWASEHPGYEFIVLAIGRNGRERIGTDASLPKARTLAKQHHQKTREKVEVIDQQGRKYFTLDAKLHEGYGRTPIEDALVKSFSDAGVQVNHLYELGNELASIDSFKFELATSKRLKDHTVTTQLRNGKRIELPLDQALELAKLWNRDMRSLKKYASSRWQENEGNYIPRYDYQCNVCEISFEADFSIADRDIPVEDTCPFCEAPVGSVERYLPRTNGLNYSAADKKPPEAFKDMLRNMKTKHRHNTINV